MSPSTLSAGDLLAWVALVTTFPVGTVKIWKGLSKDDKFDFLEGLVNVTFCCGAASWIVFDNLLLTSVLTLILLGLSPLVSWLRSSLPVGGFVCVFPVKPKHVEAANDIAKENWGTEALALSQIMPLFNHNQLTTAVMCDDAGQVVGYFDIFPMREESYSRLAHAAIGERQISSVDLLTAEEFSNRSNEASRIYFGGIATRRDIRGKTVIQEALLLWMLKYLRGMLVDDEPGASLLLKQFHLSILPYHNSEKLLVRSLALKVQKADAAPRTEGKPLYAGWVTAIDLDRAISGQERRLRRILLFRAFERFDATALSTENLAAARKLFLKVVNANGRGDA